MTAYMSWVALLTNVRGPIFIVIIISKYDECVENYNCEYFPTDKDPLSTAEVFDPETDRWTNIAPMSESRYMFGVGVINGGIYAVGGLGDSLQCVKTLVNCFSFTGVAIKLLLFFTLIWNLLNLFVYFAASNGTILKKMSGHLSRVRIRIMRMVVLVFWITFYTWLAALIMMESNTINVRNMMQKLILGRT